MIQPQQSSSTVRIFFQGSANFPIARTKESTNCGTLIQRRPGQSRLKKRKGFCSFLSQGITLRLELQSMQRKTFFFSSFAGHCFSHWFP